MLSMQRGAQGAGLGHVIASRQMQNGWQLSTVEYHEARKCRAGGTGPAAPVLAGPIF